MVATPSERKHSATPDACPAWLTELVSAYDAACEEQRAARAACEEPVFDAAAYERRSASAQRRRAADEAREAAATAIRAAVKAHVEAERLAARAADEAIALADSTERRAS